MKVRFAVAMAATLFAGALVMVLDSSLTGWISDSQCGVKGATTRPVSATTKCVKEHGAKYVFVNDADKKVYVVDAQGQGSSACRPSRDRKGHCGRRYAQAEQRRHGACSQVILCRFFS